LQTAFDELENQKCSSDSLNRDLQKQLMDHRENVRVSSEIFVDAKIRVTELSEQLKERDCRIEKLLEEVNWFKGVMTAGVNRELPH
jgi:hypothetical protein